jgi:hypothetical protein
MAIEFVDASVHDLSRATKFLHHIKPSLRDKLVFGIEKAMPFDQSVVFHLANRKKEDDVRETSIFLLSAEYILDHPYWKGLSSD